MRTRILGIILTAFVAGAMSASCAKDNAVGTQAAQTGAPRVIAVSFDNSTKSALSGNVASFTAGDVILVSNIMEKEECEVSVDASGKASITTTLLGTLKAVYPADAALLDGNAIKGVKVPSVQSGRFADANVTMADEITNRAVFTVRTALFIITPPPGTLSLELKSLKQVEGGVARTGTAVPINTDGADDAARQLISVSGLDSDGKIYVALSAGARLDDLSFDAKYAAGSGSLKGIPASVASDPVALGTSYTVNGTGWHDYLEVGGRKWAKTNIGAETETEDGFYFSWAEIVGHQWSGSSWTNFPENNPDPERYTTIHWMPSTGFSTDWYNTPYRRSGSMIKYTGSADATLHLSDDAAYYNWGGPWRMPTEADYGFIVSQGVTVDDGMLIVNGTSLKFPTSGLGDKNAINNSEIAAELWTSSLDVAQNTCARFLYATTNPSIAIQSGFRLYGMAIRPIADL